MKKIFEVALGILAAIGGFVDIGDLVFNTTAGATFGYQMLWVVTVGAIGIMFYGEMCGRVATVTQQPVFDVVRTRFGVGTGLTTLISSQFTNLMTCIAEVGGIALVLQLLTGTYYRLLVVAAAVLLILVIWVLPFQWIERIFGFGGLLLIAFTVAALKLHPHWHDVAHGFVPHIHTENYLIWGYFAVGLFSSTIMPYEVYFYSSGAIEDGWKPPTDLLINRVTAILGFGLGAFLAFSLIIVSTEFFKPAGVQPEFLGTVAVAAMSPLGQIGLLCGLLGMFFAVGGAAIDTVLAGAYNLAQFFGWPWGKHERPRRVPLFTLTWLGFILIALLVLQTGVNPIYVTEAAVVFGVLAMPFTYLPILLVARDKKTMGEHANGPLTSFIGWTYLTLLCALSLVAVPLLILTNLGQG